MKKTIVLISLIVMAIFGGAITAAQTGTGNCMGLSRGIELYLKQQLAVYGLPQPSLSGQQPSAVIPAGEKVLFIWAYSDSQGCYAHISYEMVDHWVNGLLLIAALEPPIGTSTATAIPGDSLGGTPTPISGGIILTPAATATTPGGIPDCSVGNTLEIELPANNGRVSLTDPYDEVHGYVENQLYDFTVTVPPNSQGFISGFDHNDGEMKFMLVHFPTGGTYEFSRDDFSWNHFYDFRIYSPLDASCSLDALISDFLVNNRSELNFAGSRTY